MIYVANSNEFTNVKDVVGISVQNVEIKNIKFLMSKDFGLWNRIGFVRNVKNNWMKSLKWLMKYDLTLTQNNM